MKDGLYSLIVPKSIHMPMVSKVEDMPILGPGKKVSRLTIDPKYNYFISDLVDCLASICTF